MSTNTMTKNPEEMTSAELEQLLAEKKKAERQAKAAKEKKYTDERNDFVKASIALMQGLSKELSELKQRCVVRGNELHDMMYVVYDKEPASLKSFSIEDEEKRYKVTIETSERQALDETGIVHINTIKSILKKKFAPRNKTMYKIIDDILMKNNKGDYDERLVAKLRSHEDDINDPEFSKALDDLAKAYYTFDTATYVRGYVKNLDTNKWEQIPMQFSSL